MRAPFSWCWLWSICWTALLPSAVRTPFCSSRVYLCGVDSFWRCRRTCHWIGEMPLPLSVDLAALAVFLVLSRSVVAFWFVYLFVALAAGIRWGTRRSVILAGDRHSCLADSNGHKRPAGLGSR